MYTTKMKSTERINKLKSLKESDLLKERQSLALEILSLRVDVANHKTKNIHKFKIARRDIARINTILAEKKDQNAEG